MNAPFPLPYVYVMGGDIVAQLGERTLTNDEVKIVREALLINAQFISDEIATIRTEQPHMRLFDIAQMIASRRIVNEMLDFLDGVQCQAYNQDGKDKLSIGGRVVSDTHLYITGNSLKKLGDGWTLDPQEVQLAHSLVNIWPTP